jgi:hypothetical protein
MVWLLKTGDSSPCLTLLNSDIEPHQFLPQARITSNVHKKKCSSALNVGDMYPRVLLDPNQYQKKKFGFGYECGFESR